MIGLIVGLALLGLIVWLILTYIPMPDPIKKIILVVVCLCVILYLVQLFGVLDIPIPRAR